MARLVTISTHMKSFGTSRNLVAGQQRSLHPPSKLFAQHTGSPSEVTVSIPAKASGLFLLALRPALVFFGTDAFGRAFGAALLDEGSPPLDLVSFANSGRGRRCMVTPGSDLNLPMAVSKGMFTKGRLVLFPSEKTAQEKECAKVL